MFKRILVLVISFVAMAQLAFAVVNINTADLATLATLPNIGEKKAQAIIDYRTANGPFKSVDDLANVKGIKGKTLDKVRSELSVSGVSTAVAAVKAAAPAKAAALQTPPAASAMPAKAAAPVVATVPSVKAEDLKSKAADAAKAKVDEAKSKASDKAVDAGKNKAVDALKSAGSK